MFQYIPNILISISNFYFLYLTKNKNINLLLYFPMFASFIYHLAETKNDLPGLPLLNKYTHQLLLIDRIGAVGSGSYIFSKIYYYPYLLTFEFILFGLIGFICLAYSEKNIIAEKIFNNKINISHTEFVISHIIWHLCAFKCLSLFI